MKNYTDTNTIDGMEQAKNSLSFFRLWHLNEANMYRLFWTFRNNHQWEQMFPDYETMVGYVNICGMLSHPDIVSVTYRDRNGNHHTLKNNGEVFCFVN